MYTPGSFANYPLVITHRGHLVCRAREEAAKTELMYLCGSTKVMYPDGSHPPIGEVPIYCRQCKVPLNSLSILLGEWKVKRT